MIVRLVKLFCEGFCIALVDKEEVSLSGLTLKPLSTEAVKTFCS